MSVKPFPERGHHLGQGLSCVLSLVHPHTCHQALLLVSAIKKTQLNSVAAANHVCNMLHTVANLPFYTVLRAAYEVRIVWVYGDFSATLYILRKMQ
jgi:hypothetical protein